MRFNWLSIFIIVLIVMVIAFVFYWIFGADTKLSIVTYKVSSKKISSPLRFAVVTDLHSCAYGSQQTELLQAIDDQLPDAIMLVGDIFDDKLPDENAEIFLKAIGAKYPCFYVSGNHEYRKAPERSMEDIYFFLHSCGITVLCADSIQLQVGDNTINICGMPDPFGDDPNLNTTWETAFDALNKTADDGNFTVLLSHRPSYIQTYLKGNSDLILCGHAHGGQWIIPGLINGVFAPNEGLFPKYAGGRYDFEQKTMIVSRGLATDTTIIPRIFNPPELVVVELTP